MSAYEYTPITGPQEIRLLILFPGSRSEVIKVGLEHVNLTRHSQFEALSYVWGDSREKSNVRVQRRRRKPSSSSLSSSIPTNTAAWSFEKEVTDTFNSQDWEDAGSVSITKNLAIVLDRLRYKDKPRILWVDALCINQENLDDKSEQVKRMGSNYENAQSTIVWLGPDANEVDENGEFDSELISNIQIAFDTFRKFNERTLKDGQQATDDQTTSWERRVQSPTQLMKTIFEPDGKYHIDKVARFIVQETSKSKEIVVYFGGLTINWKTLCGGAEKYLVLHGRQVALPERYIYQIRALFEAQRLRASHPNGKNLLSLLLRYRWFEATNPRDKIYGILGLAEKGLGDPGIPKVEPNYKTETSICYRDVALEIMRASENLDILQLCPRPVCLPIPNPQTDDANPLKLPSWVPDFSYDVKQVPEHTVVEDMGPITLHARLESTECPSLTASGNSQCCAELGPDGVTLTLEGFIFDTIEDQTDKFHSVKINTDDKFGFALEALRYFVRSNADEETSLRTLTHNMIQVLYKTSQTSQEQNAQLVMLAKWKRFALSLGQYPTREDLEPIFYRTMVKGDLGANREQRMTELVKAWKHTMKRIQGLGRIPGIIGGLASAISSATTPSTFPVGYIYNQRLAKTSKGYLALVPHDTEIGDKVVLLAGGKGPYMVRNSGDGEWKLVGDCYVEGLMQSEQWKTELCTGLNLV
ncbi:heterokaryon incompatibility protein-domain-containing protein [Xylaria grammica]|nr:heterokaryon incompatibility protein-domain-containing protein [Xylaria grammica]